MQDSQKKSQQQLGAVIRKYRESLELSQEDLADLVGVHRTYMGSIERGERNVSLLNIRRIASSLNLKPSEIFTEAGM
jgi:transcriptional regulator with XRE-family HTH domain